MPTIFSPGKLRDSNQEITQPIPSTVKKTSPMLALIAVALIAGWLFKGSQVDVESAASQAKQFVKAQLASPSSAEFDEASIRVFDLKDGKFKVSGHVDASNAFGVKLGQTFECYLHHSGGSWTEERTELF